MSTSAVNTPTEQSPVRVWRNVVIAAVVTLAINLAIYFIGNATGWIPDDLPERAEAFGIPAVIAYTLLPIIAGGVLLTLLVRWTNHPVIIFALIAAVVFIASLFAPLSIAGASASFRWILVAMHVATAVIATVILLRGVQEDQEY